MQPRRQETPAMQPTLIFDFRNKIVAVGGSPAASKALADVIAAQRVAIAKSMTVATKLTKA
jgi:hypothetical protein